MSENPDSSVRHCPLCNARLERRGSDREAFWYCVDCALPLEEQYFLEKRRELSSLEKLLLVIFSIGLLLLALLFFAFIIA